MPYDRRRAVRDQRPLLLFGQHGLALAVGAVMAGDLVSPCAISPCAMRRDRLRRMIVDRAVQQHRAGQGERVQQFQQPPGAHPVAVVAPGVVQDIGLRHRGELGPQPFAEGEALEVDAEIDREARPARPGPARTLRPGGIGVAAMGPQHAAPFPEPIPAMCIAPDRSASPRRARPWCRRRDAPRQPA